MTQQLTLAVNDLRDLLSAVVPFACDDGMLPVLCSVRLRARGKWLVADATDRFRIGVKRIENDDDGTWPDFEAVIPLTAVKSMLHLFRPARSGPLTEIVLTVDDDVMTVEGKGAYVLFDQAIMRYHLEPAEYPNLDSLVAKELARPADQGSTAVGLNPRFLSDYKHLGREPIQVRIGAASHPTIVMTGDGLFVSLLMPRRLFDGSSEFPFHPWADLYPAPTAADGKEVA